MNARPASLGAAELGPLVALRQAHPTASILELARLLGQQLGRPVSQSGLHRFMVAHNIERPGYAWPFNEDVAELALKANRLARERVPDPTAHARRLQALAEAFRELLVLHGEREGAGVVVLDGRRLRALPRGPVRATMRPRQAALPSGDCFGAIVATLGGGAP